MAYSLPMSNTTTTTTRSEYRTRDERRWEVKCIKKFGLIKEGQTFVVARSAYGLALFRERDLPAWTRHPLLSISNDGVVESNNKFFAAI
jgi:hypothetical protein